MSTNIPLWCRQRKHSLWMSTNIPPMVSLPRQSRGLTPVCLENLPENNDHGHPCQTSGRALVSNPVYNGQQIYPVPIQQQNRWRQRLTLISAPTLLPVTQLPVITDIRKSIWLIIFTQNRLVFTQETRVQRWPYNRDFITFSTQYIYIWNVEFCTVFCIVF